MGVTGIGGVFLRARDPVALAAWYRDHLGIGAGEHGIWPTAAGPCVFAPVPQDSDYFPRDRQLMLNLRVEGLDALLDRLRAAGVAVTTDLSWDSPEAGRFARIEDPEGHPLELWEPAPGT